ncbi:MAG TPA: uracil-DNA glycosylase family protein [Alphaproteobacteria bacterium]|nr:uracil-DNA glycosylase family protein [Alphaproteobacteria bacterium]
MLSPTPLASLLDRIRACDLCAWPHGRRPIVQLDPRARLLIVSQAPGRRAHLSGIPFQDPSGERLRDWLGIGPERFYDPARVAILPSGFCYPGTAPDNGGDYPPAPLCAPTWHPQVLPHLPGVVLTLLIGGYAQARYLAGRRQATMTETVAAWRDHLPDGLLPLPHPSWRNSAWLKRHPWFEAELLPVLRARVAEAVA